MYLQQLGTSAKNGYRPHTSAQSYFCRKISIYSQNARGLNCSQKRRDVFQQLRQKKYNILCLQDVHLENKMESYITSEWGFKVYLAGFKSNKRGVMILLNNNFEQEIYRVLKIQMVIT